MLLNRIKKNGIFYIAILTFNIFCMAQPAISGDEINRLGDNIKKTLRSLGIPESKESKTNQKNLAEVIQAFKEALSSEDEETKEILKQWDNYIVGITHFSNDEHFAAIGAQRTDYLNALNDLNERISKIDAAEKKYSSEWVDDLTRRFGRDFIKKNRNAILDNFAAIMSRSYHQYEEELKNTIYAEEMLFESYKKYFNLFLDFHNHETSDSGRRILNPHKKAAEAILALLDDLSYVSFQKTYMLREKLTLNRAKRGNNELYLFFKTNELSRNFDLSKACKDLNNAAGYTGNSK